MLDETKERITSKGLLAADEFTIEEVTRETEALFTTLWSAVWWQEGYHWKGETIQDRISFYSQFQENSRDLILYLKDGKIPIGTMRLVRNEGVGLPAFTEPVFKDQVSDLWKQQKGVEFTLLTVTPEWRGLRHLTSLMLWREGFRYVKKQNLEYAFFITDKKPLAILEKIGFPVKEIVSPREYEGMSPCGVYAIGWKDTEQELKRMNQNLFEWFDL